MQASDLLGGDLVFISNLPVAQAKLARVSELGLSGSITVELPSTVFVRGRNQLAAIKAVDSSYPLRGHNRTAPKLFAPDAEVDGGPKPGTVWAGSRLLTMLGIDVGHEIQVGDASLRGDGGADQ